MRALLGIVTRCPLVLRMKKLGPEEAWRGKVSYLDEEVELSEASQVEGEVNKGEPCSFLVPKKRPGRIPLGSGSPGFPCSQVPHCHLLPHPGRGRHAISKDSGWAWR